MRKLTYILLLFFYACSSNDLDDCFQSAGTIVQQEIDVPDFTSIIVNRDVELIINEGVTAKVVVETGKNLFDDITVEVVGDQLQLTDNNTCNFVRDYGVTKVYVTAPNIVEIRNASQFDVSSQGTLSFSDLTLISDDYQNEDVFAVGDFRVEYNAKKLSIVSNNISSFYLSGQVENLQVSFNAGTGRFEGANLLADHVTIFHRGSNDMIVNPQQSLKGELRSTGDLISVNQPPLVEVDEFYIGELIFNN